MGIDGNLTNNENEEKYTHPQKPSQPSQPSQEEEKSSDLGEDDPEYVYENDEL
jgi:hypothetical protein